MRKLFVKYNTGYCGMVGYDLLEYPEDTPDEEIDEELYWQAVEHASHYGIEICDGGEDCAGEDCEMEHEGAHNIGASWEDYDPKKHDGYLY